MYNSILLKDTNVDNETSIHYSTIYGNNISSEILQEITFYNGEDLTYQEALEELKESFIDHIKEFLESNYLNDHYINFDEMFDGIQESFNDTYESDNTVYLYDHDGYTIEYHSYDNSLIILKSPYYTYCRYASPCFPNGAYLPDAIDRNDNYNFNNLLESDQICKCYALDESFYDDEYAPMPQVTIYKVSDNTSINNQTTTS